MLERLSALVIFIVLIPLFIVFAATILLEGFLSREARGPVFYLEERISAGRPFKLIKFRTFKPAAFQAPVKAGNESFGITAVENKPDNLTRTGAFIKKIYFDELPQLVNIIKGEIGFVGPRPLIYRLYKEHLDGGNRAKDKLKAGLTGPWQINKGKISTKEEIIAVENDYLDKVSGMGRAQKAAYDLSIIFKTVKVLLEAKNV